MEPLTRAVVAFIILAAWFWVHVDDRRDSDGN